jgi:hypothetical protein
MKNNPLDDIVKCNVEISSPASDDASFDSILLVVPGPAAKGEKEMTKTTAISTADELLDYGFTTEDPAYMAAEIAFSQSPAPDELFVVIRTKPDDAYEPVKETLTRANGEAEFYGIHLTDFKDDADIQAAIEWAESNEKIFAFEYTDIDACPIKNFSYYRSFGIFSGKADGYGSDDQPKSNEYAGLAWMAKCFGYDPGTETWHLKPLATIVPSALSTAEKNDLAEKHINTFLRYAGDNITIGGYMLSGEWIDVIRFRDWLKNEMQVKVFNVLKANRKVSYTDAGIGLVEGAMEAVLASGQTIGGIAPTEYDDNDNETPGYTVTVPRSSDLTDVERSSRKLAGCKYTARLAGAIHAVEIEGFLTF